MGQSETEGRGAFLGCLVMTSVWYIAERAAAGCTLSDMTHARPAGPLCACLAFGGEEFLRGVQVGQGQGLAGAGKGQG